MNAENKSPIKDKALRHPGQSLDEEMAKIVDEEGIQYVLLAVLSTVLALFEWYRWYFSLPYKPELYSVIAVIAVIYSFFKILKIKKKLKVLKQGRDGEKAVGQYLEFLREDGCKVFHDLIGEGFNVDHVVISTNGIFTIETKTYSKPAKGKPVIRHRGDHLLINDGFKNYDVVIQANAEAHWLRSLLKDISGKAYSVRPVVVFPGWFIENETSDKGLWVLNPKALRVYINNGQPQLTPQEVQFLANGLSRHIRNTLD